MTFPKSDHYDGALFFNPEPTIRRETAPGTSTKRRGFLSLIGARLRKDPEFWSAWPKHVVNAPYPPPGGPPSITFIGHSSFLIRLAGLTILTDPVFSQRCSPSQLAGPKRVRAPGIALAALPAVDLILLSHNHYDHMDIASLRLLRKKFPAVQIIAPLGNAAFLDRKRLPGVTELDWWQSHFFDETVVIATPARHFAARTLWDRNKTLWCGYMVEHRGQKLYFAGDTGYTKFFTEIRFRLGAPDLALLPIGAYEPRWFMGAVHMNPADAVQALQDLGAPRAVGMHFGTFQLTAEAIDAPLRDLADALAQADINSSRFFTLDVGESKVL